MDQTRIDKCNLNNEHCIFVDDLQDNIASVINHCPNINCVLAYSGDFFEKLLLLQIIK